jgi:hypothetical protein
MCRTEQCHVSVERVSKKVSQYSIRFEGNIFLYEIVEIGTSSLKNYCIFVFFNFKKHTYIRGKTCISQSHIDIINCELYKFSSLKQTELDFYKIGFLVSWGWCKSAGIVL